MLLDAGVEWNAGVMLGRGLGLIREGMCHLLLALTGGTPNQILTLLYMAEEVGTIIHMDK